MMRGVLFKEKKLMEYHVDLPKPEIKKDEVLIQVKCCGICGSDIESYETGTAALPGIVLGHEFSGLIVERGNQVDEKLNIDDRVTGNPGIWCGKCDWCERGYPNMCVRAGTGLGLTDNGAFAEFVKIKADNVHQLPLSVSFKEAAMIEPLCVALYSVKTSNFKKGENAVVFGAGTIGLLVIQLLKLAGASSVIVIEPIGLKQEKALEVDADHVFHPNKWSKVNKLTKTVGPIMHVFDCAGNPSTFMTSMKLIHRGGLITVVGIHSEPFEMKGFMQLMLKNITMRGIYGYVQDNWTEAINLLKDKRINLTSIITKTISLEDVPKTFEELSKREHDDIKVIVKL